MVENVYMYLAAIEMVLAFMCLWAAGYGICAVKNKGPKGHTINTMMIVGAVLMALDSLAYQIVCFTGNYYNIVLKIACLSNFIMAYIFFILFTHYVGIFLEGERGVVAIKRLVTGICIFNTFMAAFSCWTHLYFYYDENGAYHRGSMFLTSQILSTLAMVIVLGVVFHYRKKLRPSLLRATISYFILVLSALILQIVFRPPLQLQNIGLGFSIMFQYFYYNEDRNEVLRKKEIELKDMQIKLVESQLQPHMIFNVLNSIYYLCDTDAKKAQKALGMFSDYLRGNFESLSISHLIPIDSEIRHVKGYLELEKMRFEDELQVEYDIDNLDFKIPPLSIQPIVENAVKHGVCQRPEGGCVTLRVKETKDQYLIEVIDDGVGFDVNSNPVDKNGRISHIGIASVRERITDMCNGTMEVESTLDVGTKVTISIPKAG